MTTHKMMEALMLLNTNTTDFWFLVQETETSLTFESVEQHDECADTYYRHTVVVIYEDNIGIHETDLEENITGTAFLNRFEWETFMSIQQLKFPKFEALEFPASPEWLFD